MQVPGTGIAAGWRQKEVVMSAIVRSWVRIYCPNCQERQTYVLRDQWVLVCSSCGHEKTLKTGILTV